MVIIESNGFDMLVTKPTRAIKESTTCLDHFQSKDINTSATEVLEDQNFTDHFPILFSCTINLRGIENKSVFRDTSFLKFDQLTMNCIFKLSHELGKSGLSVLDSNFEDSFFSFHKTVCQATDQFAPFRTSKKCSRKMPEWFTNNLKKFGVEAQKNA